MHIPKTAGSSICDMFAFTFDRFLRDAQSQPGKGQALLDGDETFFVGGHFLFAAAQDYIRREDIFSFTVLRDPIQQVISHLKWVKAYGNPPRADKRAEINPALAALAIELWNIPLDDVTRVKGVIDGPVRPLFYNLQTHYFCAHEANDVARAFSNLEQLSFYFTLEDISGATGYISRQVGHLEEQKITNTAMIDENVNLGDPEIRAGYCEMIELDIEFYERVRDASRDRFGIGP